MTGAPSAWRPGVPLIVLAAALLAPLAHVLPDRLAAAARVPPGHAYLHTPYMVDDHLQYFALIRESARTGSPFVANPFTAEEQPGRNALLLFWLLGLLQRATGWPQDVLWHGALIACGAAYVLAFYRLTRHTFEHGSERWRTAAACVFAFGGGCLAISTALARLSPPLSALAEPGRDFWNWSALGTTLLPHWSLPAALLLLALDCWLAGEGRHDARSRFAPALLLPVVWLLHPYTGIAGYLCFSLLLLWPLGAALASGEPLDRRLWAERARAVLPALASFALIACYLLWARADPVYRVNSEEALRWRPTYTIGWYPSGYGVLLLLAAFGWRARRALSPGARQVLLALLASALLLSVNPLFAGVKFQYLLFPPLVLLASLGARQLSDTRPGVRALRQRPAAGLLLVALLLADGAWIAARASTRAIDQAALVKAADLRAIAYLDTLPRGVVLSSARTGNVIPALSGQRVFVGHWFMTIDYRGKRRAVELLWSPQVTLSAKVDFLRRSGARYLYSGSAEAAQGALAPGLPLRALYDRDGVAIYELALGDPGG